MSDRVKVGIIGIGFMGSTHFRIYQQNPNAEVVAIADIDPKKLAGDWSAIVGNIGDFDNSKSQDLGEIKTFTDPDGVIDDPEVDLVDICVPTPWHKEIVLRALESGKNVFCEKPLARSSTDAIEIVRAAKKTGVVFSTGLCMRYWPEYVQLQEAVQSGALGTVKSATFTRVSPNVFGNSWENWLAKSKLSGSALLDLHIHDTDMVLALFGRPLAVTSFGASGTRSDGIDHCVTIYHFFDDKFVTSEGSWIPAKGLDFEMRFLVTGSNATAKFVNSGLQVYDEKDGEKPSLPKPTVPTTGWHREIDYVVNCVLNKRPATDHVTLQEMVDSLAIIEAEERSIQSGRRVEIEYVTV